MNCPTCQKALPENYFSPYCCHCGHDLPSDLAKSRETKQPTSLVKAKEWTWWKVALIAFTPMPVGFLLATTRGNDFKTEIFFHLLNAACSLIAANNFIKTRANNLQQRTLLTLVFSVEFFVANFLVVAGLIFCFLLPMKM